MRTFPVIALLTALIVTALIQAPTIMAEDTIKIATFDPLSGPMKYIGDNYNWGLKFNIREWNKKHGGLLGKKIELIPYDSQLKPDVAKRLATEAILKKKVHVLATGCGSHVAAALAQLGKKYKTLVVSYGAEAASLTGKGCNPYFFRISLNTGHAFRRACSCVRQQAGCKKGGHNLSGLQLR